MAALIDGGSAGPIMPSPAGAGEGAGATPGSASDADAVTPTPATRFFALLPALLPALMGCFSAAAWMMARMLSSVVNCAATWLVLDVNVASAPAFTSSFTIYSTEGVPEHM